MANSCIYCLTESDDEMNKLCENELCNGLFCNECRSDHYMWIIDKPCPVCQIEYTINYYNITKYIIIFVILILLILGPLTYLIILCLNGVKVKNYIYGPIICIIVLLQIIVCFFCYLLKCNQLLLYITFLLILIELYMSIHSLFQSMLLLICLWFEPFLIFLLIKIIQTLLE